VKLNSLLACSTCGSELTISADQTNNSTQFNWLICRSCRLKFPVVYGFPLFLESIAINKNYSNRKKDYLLKCFDPKNSAYKDYIEKKTTKNIFEVYAAMQPFNESGRAFFPFIDKIKKSIRIGDVIIDAWARTGWHALLLSALFPDQQIIALWDGNTSVLGYSGYGYWFSKEKRPKNIEVIFVEANKPLPIKTDTATLIFAHDAMHRYHFPLYPSELIRISNSSSFIMMPHIHLSNNKPEPFFERGGIIRHSSAYYQSIHRLLDEKNQEFMLISESELFNHQQNATVNNIEDGTDYNGFGIIAPKNFFKNKFSNVINHKITSFSYLIVNPLLTFNPFNGHIMLKAYALGGSLLYYLKRHPCYEKRLQSIRGYKLNMDCIKLLLLTDLNLTLEEYSNELGWSDSYCKDIVNILYNLELIMPLSTSHTAVELQEFYNNKQGLLPESFIDFWEFMLNNHPETKLLNLEGNKITVSETHELILSISKYFIDNKTNNNDNDSDAIKILSSVDPVKLQICMMSAWWIGSDPQIIIRRDKDEAIFPVKEKRLTKKPFLFSNSSTNTDSNNIFWSIIEKNIGVKISPIRNNLSSCWYRELFK
jgi:uncharacterized protein YbaR (Trm112 family)